MFELLSLYRLIILYMLDNVSYPLQYRHISDFILENDYTDYFTLSQAVGELADGHMIDLETRSGERFCRITPEGRKALQHLQNKISEDIKKDVRRYLKENASEIVEEASVVSSYYKNTQGDYSARLQICEKKNTILDLTLTVPTKQQASLLCQNWKEHSSEIYAHLIHTLLDQTP